MTSDNSLRESQNDEAASEMLFMVVRIDPITGMHFQAKLGDIYGQPDFNGAEQFR